LDIVNNKLERKWDEMVTIQLKEKFHHLTGEIKAVWLVMRVIFQQTQTSHSPHCQTPPTPQKRERERQRENERARERGGEEQRKKEKTWLNEVQVINTVI
jgi:hypothetical protein